MAQSHSQQPGGRLGPCTLSHFQGKECMVGTVRRMDKVERHGAECLLPRVALPKRHGLHTSDRRLGLGFAGALRPSLFAAAAGGRRHGGLGGFIICR